MNVCQEYQAWLLYYFKLTATVVQKLKQFGVFAVKMFKKSPSSFSLLTCLSFYLHVTTLQPLNRLYRPSFVFLEILLNFVSMFKFHKHGVHIADTEHVHVFLCALLKVCIR